ncbi:IS1380 family transposase [Stieleria sp. ICT_E10.1]|uniref:IS1380 family transposase n=1 Tax=Stieleria sedimenti TaxID=2976331 RepID=UPI00217F61D8|nr:IS1380 family transposase [Stieleria sedimenti]MCS7466790.1 IS1380 family transposase [Stieleria sedimenti]
MIRDAQPALFDFFPRKSIEVQSVDEQVSSDGGLIVFRELDQKLKLTESFAEQIEDGRSDPTQSLLSVIRQRVFGILAGYEDQNDHDTLRTDPVFKLIADRAPDEHDLASQPTISRVENSVTASDLLRLEDWFIDRFVESFDEVPTRITLDIDTFADSAHGAQQLTFFNNFYKKNIYQVRVITCAENDQIVLPVLLHGTAHVSLAAEDDLSRVVNALRKRFPDLEIRIRADAGFAVPNLYEALESLAGVTYSIGYQMNQLMRKKCEKLMELTLQQFEKTGEETKNYMYLSHKARGWSHARDMVIKCEANIQGTNRRIVVTNRLGAEQYPDGTYQEYSDRGESENRNKELTVDLSADRLIDHRYMANLFRMMMHALSCNLLSRLRSVAADPPPEVGPDPEGVPLEAGSDHRKRTAKNRRRRVDPLGRGRAMTWRTLVIKVAARVEATTRRIRLLIPSSWPHGNFLFKVSRSLAGFSPSG